MKKILILNGSPNKKGNTTKIIEKLLDGINKELADIEVVNCYEKKISCCIDCGLCKKKCGECSIKDDMIDVYRCIDDSDIIVLASPMYFGMFPGTLKSLIDRCQMIWSRRHIFKKTSKLKAGFLVFDAGSTWHNMFEPMITVSKYFLNTVGCKSQYKVLIDNTDNNIDILKSSKHDLDVCQNMINNILNDSI